MKIEKTIAKYIEKLDRYSEEQFLWKPDEHSWSLGQVFVHVILANDHFFLKQAARCLDKDDTSKGKGKNKWGKILFLINGFPNKKYKMPKSVEVQPRQPEGIDPVREKLKRSLELAKTLEGRLKNFDRDEKTRHPAFGYLNAMEWYRVADMHFRHHLRQVRRIEKRIGQ